MQKLKCAVIGVGYLGRFHAQKYKMLDDVELVGVCDIDQNTALKVAQELNVKAFTDYKKLLNLVDAVSISATTNAHFAIAKECLKAGVHVLIEKPITETTLEAQELISLAHENHLKLQVGHLERFNPARLAIEKHLDEPLFIESNRLSTFNPRGTDVNVILDLMIHDIDIIQSIVHSPIVSIEAQGAPILTKSIDIANARLTFANKCVANVTASRISFKTERKTRIFQKDTYISIDFHNRQFAIFKKGDGEMFPGIPDIVRDESSLIDCDSLLLEIKSFVTCVKEDKAPLVSGEDGLRALSTAEKISSQINNNLIARYALV